MNRHRAIQARTAFNVDIGVHSAYRCSPGLSDPGMRLPKGRAFHHGAFPGGSFPSHI
jgi:hypothetical protein